MDALADLIQWLLHAWVVALVVYHLSGPRTGAAAHGLLTWAFFGPGLGACAALALLAAAVVVACKGDDGAAGGGGDDADDNPGGSWHGARGWPGGMTPDGGTDDHPSNPADRTGLTY